MTGQYICDAIEGKIAVKDALARAGLTMDTVISKMLSKA